MGFKLFTKFNEKGVVNLSKAVPFLGGVIGGAVDAASTDVIGNAAINFFLS